jgi:Ca-activated chloride channel family protein
VNRCSLLGALLLLASCSSEVWWTPDQQGQRALDAERFEEAAQLFRDPMRRGVALYRASRFEESAAVFGRTESAEGAFNRGTALVMAGKYEAALESFDRALALRPEFPEAVLNREVAQARLAALAAPEDDAGGTGGKLGADEIVFDDRAKNSSSAQIEVGAGEPLSDEELRSLWLQRVETKPADFLRVKFAYQKAVRSVEEEEQ